MNKIREIKKETKTFENLKIYATIFLKECSILNILLDFLQNTVPKFDLFKNLHHNNKGGKFNLKYP